MKIFETENSDTNTGRTFTYSYYVDGIEYKLRSSVRSPETHKVGDIGTIWYNPKKPKDAQAFRYESNKVYKILFLIGLAMLLLGLVLFVVGVGMS